MRPTEGKLTWYGGESLWMLRILAKNNTIQLVPEPLDITPSRRGWRRRPTATPTNTSMTTDNSSCGKSVSPIGDTASLTRVDYINEGAGICIHWRVQFGHWCTHVRNQYSTKPYFVSPCLLRIHYCRGSIVPGAKQHAIWSDKLRWRYPVPIRYPISSRTILFIARPHYLPWRA